MKIEPQGLDHVEGPKSRPARAVRNGAAVHHPYRRSEGLGGRDEAALSEIARLMAKAHQALDETPETRAELVAALKQQLEDGTYEVPIQALAERLVSRLKGD